MFTENPKTRIQCAKTDLLDIINGARTRGNDGGDDDEDEDGEDG
jgi:hypothetical protein